MAPDPTAGDPYDILGVGRDATTSEIKSAYRKLALRNHPDKVRGDAETKARASQIFTKIGAAYEILSDDQKRKEYDSLRGVSPSSSFSPTSMGGCSDAGSFFGVGAFPGSPGSFGGGFGGFGGFHDPFFEMSRRHGGIDPFDLFDRVFGEDFSRRHPQAFRQQEQQQDRVSPRRGRSSDPFDDPFFADPFSVGPMGGGFGGGGGAGMDRMIQRLQEQSSQPRGSTTDGGGTTAFSSYTSTSSSSFGGNNGMRESVTTTTRMVNGKQVTRTERTFIGPDGKVRRTVETKGDETLLPPQPSQPLPSTNNDKSPALKENAPPDNGRKSYGLRSFFNKKRSTSRPRTRSRSTSRSRRKQGSGGEDED